MATRTNIINNLEILYHYYKPKDMDEKLLGIYADNLTSIPDEWLGRVTVHIIQSSKWFPRVSDILSAYRQLSQSQHDVYQDEIDRVGYDLEMLVVLDLDYGYDRLFNDRRWIDFHERRMTTEWKKDAAELIRDNQ